MPRRRARGGDRGESFSRRGRTGSLGAEEAWVRCKELGDVHVGACAAGGRGYGGRVGGGMRRQPRRWPCAVPGLRGCVLPARRGEITARRTCLSSAGHKRRGLRVRPHPQFCKRCLLTAHTATQEARQRGAPAAVISWRRSLRRLAAMRCEAGHQTARPARDPRCIRSRLGLSHELVAAAGSRGGCKV